MRKIDRKNKLVLIDQTLHDNLQMLKVIKKTTIKNLIKEALIKCYGGIWNTWGVKYESKKSKK